MRFLPNHPAFRPTEVHWIPTNHDRPIIPWPIDNIPDDPHVPYLSRLAIGTSTSIPRAASIGCSLNSMLLILTNPWIGPIQYVCHIVANWIRVPHILLLSNWFTSVSCEGPNVSLDRHRSGRCINSDGQSADYKMPQSPMSNTIQVWL